ncbi:MAG: hypothetical protein LH615_08910 [Ferruginibacter sp.]|nr:hypothetical protein [Ferruginibacter sp.]
MKTLTSHKYITAIIAIAVFALVFNGCKKADLKADTNTTGQSDLERAKANTKKRIEEMGGVPQVFTVHKKMITTWADKNGVPMDPKVTINSAGCTNYDLPDYTELVQYQRIYNCSEPGYFIQFEYNVSWSKNIVPLNFNSIATEGFIWIQDDATGTLNYYYTADKNDVTITDLGVDPNNSFNHIYNVKFDYGKANHSGNAIPTGQINGDINGTYTVKLGATFASDCPDSYGLNILPAHYFGFTSATGENPCERNDYPLFQAPSIFANQDRIGIAGYDPLSTCSQFGGSFVRTDLQQVEYSINGGTSFSPFPNVLGGGSTTNFILQYGYLRYNDFAESPVIASGTYTVILRFRNWKYSSGIPNPLNTIPAIANGDCTSPSYSNDPGYPTGPASWAYEYWPGVVIQ